MNQPEETPERSPANGKSPWQVPTVTFVGSLEAIVRGGAAEGKISGGHDGDATNARLPHP